VTDGIVWQLPALILYTKLLRKAALVDLRGDGERSRTRAIDAVHSLSLAHVGPKTRSPARTWRARGATPSWRSWRWRSGRCRFRGCAA